MAWLVSGSGVGRIDRSEGKRSRSRMPVIAQSKAGLTTPVVKHDPADVSVDCGGYGQHACQPRKSPISVRKVATAPLLRGCHGRDAQQ